MERQIERVCKSCHGCQVTSGPDPPEPIKSTPLPDGPWQHIAVDFLGPIENIKILVLVDYFSRYIEYELLRNTTTRDVVNVYDHVFARHGLPLSIKSDNGPPFDAKEYEAYLKHNRIKPTPVTPKYAQANGEVEIQNKSIGKRIKIAHEEGKDWKYELLTYIAQYRVTPHTVTGKSPSSLMFNREIRCKLPSLTQRVEELEVRDRDSEHKMKSKLYADKKRNAQPCDINVDDSVLVKRDQPRKIQSPYRYDPFSVVDKSGNQLTVESSEGVQYKRNNTYVKKFVDSDTDLIINDNVHNDVSDKTVTVDENTTVDDVIPSDDTSAIDTHINTDNSCASSSRPIRERRKPAWLKDYKT